MVEWVRERLLARAKVVRCGARKPPLQLIWVGGMIVASLFGSNGQGLTAIVDPGTYLQGCFITAVSPFPASILSCFRASWNVNDRVASAQEGC